MPVAQQGGPRAQSIPFGAGKLGVLDTANPSVVPPDGALREAEHFILTGLNRLSVRPGLVTTLALYNTWSGTIVPVTSVLYVGTFSDKAIVITHSTVTNTVDLFLFTADMQNFFDDSGTEKANSYVTSVTGGFPAGGLAMTEVWAGINVAPDVLVTEGLGYLYITNTVASDAAGLYWPTVYWDAIFPVSGGVLPSLTGSGTYDSSGNFTPGSDVVYFNGVIGFQQALWGWGYDFGSSVADAYRPEMARFSQPNFGPLALTDSITLGDRVRSARERIIGAGVAGQSLFLGGDQLVSRVTGYGRDSWQKVQVDQSWGFVGPKCMVTVGTYLYWWSPRGPLRIEGLNPYSVPEPLWDAVQATALSIINPSKIVALADLDRDQIIWMYDSGQDVRTFCAYDYRREVWVGPRADFGVVIRAAGSVRPLYASTATSPQAPTGPPTTPTTTSITSTGATANWIPADNFSQIEISVELQTAGTWAVAALLAAGSTTYTFTGQSFATGYQWRVRASFNGQFSSYLGPVTATEYTTLNSGTTLSAPTGFNATVLGNTQVNPNVRVSWVNTVPTAGIEIWAQPPSGSFVRWSTLGTGVASTVLTLTTTGAWFLKCRHIETGFTPSAYSNMVSAFIVQGSGFV